MSTIYAGISVARDCDDGNGVIGVAADTREGVARREASRPDHEQIFSFLAPARVDVIARAALMNLSAD